jgi:F0F1-type ATP synthase assembly protein I
MGESHVAFIFMIENDKDINIEKSTNKSGENYWKPVILFYAKTTSWIILPLLFGTLAGKYVSSSFGSQLVFFIFIMLGFLVTCLGIYREVKQYKKSLDIPLLKNEEK